MLARLESISLFFPDKTVLEDVSLTINPKDRIVLFGESGSGKTSLSRILTGRLKPNSGKVSLTRGLRIGYLEQDFAALGNESTCLEAALEPFGPLILLEQRIARLSERLGQAGGEEMEKLEPTNHLDIETQDVLLDALQDFPGGILFVSHDRYFIDSLATHTLLLGEGAKT